MALNSESLRSILLLCMLITSCVGQTFQYSRGWVNGKRSGMAFLPSKTSDHLIIGDEIPEIPKQFFSSDQYAGSNPIAVHVTAMNPLPIQEATFYQRPQMKYDSNLLVSAIPYGLIETPLTPSLNAIGLTERFKRSVKTNMFA